MKISLRIGRKILPLGVWRFLKINPHLISVTFDQRLRFAPGNRWHLRAGAHDGTQLRSILQTKQQLVICIGILALWTNFHRRILPDRQIKVCKKMPDSMMSTDAISLDPYLSQSQTFGIQYSPSADSIIFSPIFFRSSSFTPRKVKCG